MLRLLFPRTLMQWTGPILSCGLFVVIIGLTVLISGSADLSASTPHPEGWAEMLHYAFKRSVAHHSAGDAVPADLDSPAMVIKGATYYARACSHCHGVPGLGQNPVALMMRPRPQYLPAVVGQFSPAELHYIVLHGVKYSGMPAWPAQSRGDEVWSVVAFLRTITKMDYRQFRALSRGDATASRAVDQDFAFAAPKPLASYALHAADQPSSNEYSYLRPAFGFNPFADVQDPRASCATCHGSNGTGRENGAFPNLTIQTPTYLQNALTAFAAGTRKSAFMQTLATQLSPQQINALAAYYGSLPATPSSSVKISDTKRQAGAQIVAYGIRDRGVGACSSCHGITRAIGDAVPRLEGQSAHYLIDQMRAFRGGGRGSSRSVNPMNKVAHDLTEPEIVAIANYYATTSPALKAVSTARQAAAK